MNLFTIAIPDSAASLLVTYGAGALIRVQSSPTSGGVYGNVVTVPIVSGVSVYPVYDALGSGSDWYKYRYEAADGDPAGSYSAVFQPVPNSGIYASLATFSVYLRDAGTDATDDVLKLLALEAASRAIDKSANRRFEIATGTPSARVFTPTRRGVFTPSEYSNEYPRANAVVSIDDTFDDSPTISFDTTRNGDYDLTSTAFRVGPTNAPSFSRPFTQVIFNSGTFPPSYDYSVEVTADWGWPSIPATITNACLLQASRFYKRRESPYGVAGSGEMGTESRLLSKLDPDVAVMVNAYRRPWGAV